MTRLMCNILLNLLKILDFFISVAAIPNWPISLIYQIICGLHTINVCRDTDKSVDFDKRIIRGKGFPNLQRIIIIGNPVGMTPDYLFDILENEYSIDYDTYEEMDFTYCGNDMDFFMHTGLSQHLIMTFNPLDLNVALGLHADLERILETTIDKDIVEDNKNVSKTDLIKLANESKVMIFIIPQIMRIGSYKITSLHAHPEDSNWGEDILKTIAAKSGVTTLDNLITLICIRSVSIVTLMSLIYSLLAIFTNDYIDTSYLPYIYLVYVYGGIMLEMIRYIVGKIITKWSKFK